MDIRKVKKLIELLEESNIDELEIKEGEESVRISRNSNRGFAPIMSMPAQYAAAPQAPAAAPAAPAAAEAAPAEGNKLRGHIIRSPMVGTFYRSPEPSAPAFVEVGDVVKKGQVLCIIEAMKLMNEIESDRDGEIAAIYVENGKPVQFGDRLFAIKVS